MNELIEEYTNEHLEIFLLGKRYHAQFYCEDNQLKIRLLDLMDRETALKCEKNFKIVNGIINSKDITFFDMKKCGLSYAFKGEEFELRFIFNEFIENYKYRNKNERKISVALVEFYNINDFTETPFYDYSEHLNPVFNSKCYGYNFQDKKISIFCGKKATTSHYSYKMEKTISIEFKYNNPQKYQDIMKDIYHFKAFLSIISKREIGLKKVRINELGILFLNCIKFTDKIPDNIFLAHKYNEFVLTLEKIESNFGEIYDKFDSLFNNSSPAFEIYLDILQHDTSSLNKFLNYTQILEYISKNYDKDGAYNTWLKNSKKGQNISLSNRIESILNHVSYIWNFDNKKIHQLAIKIANGRNYYNHHTNISNKLSNDDLFRLPYFLEDAMLAFIYQYIGVEKTIIADSLARNIHYFKFI